MRGLEARNFYEKWQSFKLIAFTVFAQFRIYNLVLPPQNRVNNIAVCVFDKVLIKLISININIKRYSTLFKY